MLYKQNCSKCHGIRGEKVHRNMVPPIRSLNPDIRLKRLFLYKFSERNAYGFEIEMKDSLKHLNSEDLQNINRFINTFIQD